MTQPTSDYGQTSVRDEEITLIQGGPPESVPPGAGTSSSTGGGGASSTAGRVKDSTAEAGSQVASTVKEEAADVARQARSQARDLVGEGRDEALRQAGEQQRKVAGSLRQVAGEFHGMAQSTDSSGIAAELVRQLSDRTGQAADWFEQRQPGEILDDVRDYARRHPWTFLGAAAVAGLVVGRLGRAAAQGGPDGASGVPGSTASTQGADRGQGSPYPASRFGEVAEPVEGAQPTSSPYFATQGDAPAEGQYTEGRYAGTEYPGSEYPGSQYPGSQYPGSQYPEGRP